MRFFFCENWRKPNSGVYLSTSCEVLEVTLISQRMSPDSNTSRRPVSVPAITRSSDIQTWDRIFRDSSFWKLHCFRAPSR